MKREIKHYELVRKLGAGGSGVVYLANDTQLMRPVVLKILRRASMPMEQMRTTVLREARMASAIEHPNVCAIYEVGEDADEAYIVMQYVPGQASIRSSRMGRPSLQLLLSVGIQIADGLSAAHQLGIFHRDLKPANVMLTDGGLVKILDFGLARRLPVEEAEFDPSKPAPRPGPKMTYTARGGTIAYMAPEQFVTGQSSVQSDIWALGLILYEMVSGRHPFVRPDGDEMRASAQSSMRIRFRSRLLRACAAGAEQCDLPLPRENAFGALWVGGGSARSAEDDHEGDADRDGHHPRRCRGESSRFARRI